MHQYFIDSPLSAPHYAKALGRIEARLTDLGIKGKMTRLTPLHDLATCVREAIAAGADTLVAVGNDHLLSRIASVLKSHPRLILGMIPFGPGARRIPQTMGIPDNLPACDTLAARRTEMLDMGVINGIELFIAAAEIPALPCTIECDQKFTVQESPPLHAAVLNLIAYSHACAPARPDDGRFTVCLTRPPSSPLFRAALPAAHSTWYARTVRIVPAHSDLTVMIDGFRRVRAPLMFEVLPRHLSFIVGRLRKF